MGVGPRGLIPKANFTFAAMFFWLIDLHRLSPMATDNILTWDRAVLVVALVARLEIDVAKLLISVIHERDLMFSTTFPFQYMIFQMCRDAGVLIFHKDILCTPIGTANDGLIRDEANEVVPR